MRFLVFMIPPTTARRSRKAEKKTAATYQAAVFHSWPSLLQLSHKEGEQVPTAAGVQVCTPDTPTTWAHAQQLRAQHETSKSSAGVTVTRSVWSQQTRILNADHDVGFKGGVKVKSDTSLLCCSLDHDSQSTDN